jgi:hypothetical protein
VSFKNKEITQAKINARYHSRELIHAVFKATENFLKNDTEGIGPMMRKKALAISSFLTHGTVNSNIEEQKENYIVVMGELKELLKLSSIAHQLGFLPDQSKSLVRLGISNLINALDKLVIQLGGFDH